MRRRRTGIGYFTNTQFKARQLKLHTTQTTNIMSVPEQSQGARGEVTLNSPPPKVRNPVFRWCWTIKSTLIGIEDLKSVLCQKCRAFRFQEEVGAAGYQHYQGQMTLLKKDRMSGVLKWLPRRTHLEETKDEAASLRYVCKEEGRIAGPWEHGMEGDKPKRKKKEEDEPLRLIVPDREWQKEILEIVEKQPDDRSIYWFWEPVGNIGKTQFAKYLCAKHKALYANGKKGDILHAASEMKCQVVIVDIERDQEEVPYGALEAVKNGIFFSGKYDSKQVIRNSPHVIVFANRAPDLERLSKDRWIVREIV